MSTSTHKPADPRLFMCGDSTMTKDTTMMFIGWGLPAQSLFNLEVSNAAVSGKSARSFIENGNWDLVEADLRPGDYVIISFGHNDQGIPGIYSLRASAPGEGNETMRVERAGRVEIVQTWSTYIRKMIDGSRAKGAFPILVSPTALNPYYNRISPDPMDGPKSPFQQYAANVAREKRVLYVDLWTATKSHYHALGQDRLGGYFIDRVHTQFKGAKIIARIFARELYTAEKDWGHGIKELRDAEDALREIEEETGEKAERGDEELHKLLLQDVQKLSTYLTKSESAIEDQINAEFG